MATKSIAIDYGAHGIRCNALLPGCVEKPMTYEGLLASIVSVAIPHLLAAGGGSSRK